ncbi:MAG: dTMP kinase [Bacteroidales bacterium]|jgi:dTMP kinase|nr:dTMP kinase [Bacteroidales bacterium]
MKLVVIEGLDGAGKSTQIKMLTGYLEGKNLIYRYIHFPRTDAPFFGELVARFLRGEFGTVENVDPYLVAMLYAGDRKDAADEINEWLSEDNLVILDRYTYSNIAYQCAKLRDLSERQKLRKWILDLEFSHFRIPVPDINIFLDVPLSFTSSKLNASRQGDDRKYLRGLADIHETDIDFQKRVRDTYLETAATDDRLTILDCHDQRNNMLPPADIFRMILNLLKIRSILP